MGGGGANLNRQNNWLRSGGSSSGGSQLGNYMVVRWLTIFLHIFKSPIFLNYLSAKPFVFEKKISFHQDFANYIKIKLTGSKLVSVVLLWIIWTIGRFLLYKNFSGGYMLSPTRTSHIYSTLYYKFPSSSEIISMFLCAAGIS